MSIKKIKIGEFSMLMPRKSMSVLLIAISVIIITFGVAFAIGTSHPCVGTVSGGPTASGDQYFTYIQSRTGERLTGTLVGAGPILWSDNSGNFTTPWTAGDNMVVVIEKEQNGGTATHTGWYSINNKALTSAASDNFGASTMRQIPVPTATAGNAQVSLSWSAAAGDGESGGSNISGYNIYRSTSQSSGFTKINSSLVSPTSYTDTTASNGVTYYYCIKLVFLGNVEGTYLSANSNAVIPIAGPSLTSVTPGTIYIGDSNTNINIVGSSTNFNGTSVVSFAGGGITINSTTVTDATHITVNVTIPQSVTAGSKAVTVTTGAETATGRSIAVVAPSLNALSPNNGTQGQSNISIVVSGNGTHFNGGTSTPSFSGSGITVNSTTINSPTSATVDISIAAGAAAGSRTFTMTTTGVAGGTETVTSAFTVNAIGVPVITNCNPNSGTQGQTLNVVITGSYTTFINGTSIASFGSGITVNSLTVASATSATANITIASGAAVGARNVTVTTNAEIATGNNMFTVNTSGSGGGTTYSISGTVTHNGNPLPNVVISISGAGTATTTTDANGQYSVSGLANGSYTVVPSLDAYTFAPVSRSETISGANLTGIDFAATAVTYSISGNVTDNNGQPLSNVAIRVVDSSGTTTYTGTTDASGSYITPGLAIGNYTVIPALPGYTFNPINRSVFVGPDAIGINFIGTLNTGSYNYPNPFNPSGGQTTNIVYALPQNADVKIYIFDITARLLWMRTYLAGAQGGTAGVNEVTWNGRDDYGQIVGQGVYLYRIIRMDNNQLVGKGKILAGQ